MIRQYFHNNNTFPPSLAHTARTHSTHDVHVFFSYSHTLLSEGSVQQHRPPYSFRKGVIVRSVMKSFPWKTKEKKARFARAPHDNIRFTAPKIHIDYIYHHAFFRALRYVRLTVCLFFFSKSGVYPCLLAVFWYYKLVAPASDCLRLFLNRQARLPTLNSRNSTTNSSSTHQPPAALQIDQSLYSTWKMCRQPGFTACSARESTTTEITGPKLIGCTGTSTTLQKVKKRQL